MTKMTLNQAFQVPLHGVGDPLELCDDSGQTIGVLISIAEHDRLRQLEADFRRLQESVLQRIETQRRSEADYYRRAYAWAQTQFTDEDLDAFEQQTEEYTTEEVMRHLGNS